MCRFIETLCIENGEIRNLPYHNQRLNETRMHFWQDSTPLQLEDYVKPVRGTEAVLGTEPAQETKSVLGTEPGKGTPKAGRFKARVVYGQAGIEEVSYAPYLLRPVQSLALIQCDALEYAYKSTDRTALNLLFAQRSNYDDILIVRHGLLTDTSIANIALYDGSRWYTPRHPLLKGTKRTQLLEDGILLEEELRPEDLSAFSAIRLFNAMISWGEQEILLPMETNVAAYGDGFPQQ